MPEIRRLDLSEVVLTLKAAGVDDLRKFRWLEKPDEISLTHAEELLEDLGAIKAARPAADATSGRSAHVTNRAQDAGLSAASPLCADAAGGAGIQAACTRPASWPR
jgi:HrpA-like RNA helicase